MLGSESQSSYVSYKRKLNTLVADMKEIRDQAKRAVEDPVEIPLFKGMHMSLATTYERFETTYDDLCDLIDEHGKSVATTADHDLRARARRYFHEINGFWTTLNDISLARTSDRSSGLFRAKTKLPTLELPKFSGNRTKWPRFKDTFTSLVKEDLDLSDIDRFHYLIRSLEGNASAVIAHVPITDGNFEVAWAALVETYDNNRLLAAAYLDQILDTKPLTHKPSADELNKLISSLVELVAAFKLLAVPDKADFLFFHIARRCLDPRTREEFEIDNRETFPTFEALVKYLRARCTASELASGLSQVTSVRTLSSGRKSPPVRPKPWHAGKVALVGNAMKSSSYQSHLKPGSTAQSPLFLSRKTAKVKCPACGEFHHLANCLKFSTATVDERHRTLQTWRGCRNCLQSDHGTSRCLSTYRCRFCRGKHHSLLHSSLPLSDTPQTSKSETSAASNYRTSPSSTSLSSVASGQLEVMLGTAMCHIADNSGHLHEARLVIDSGSHFSFISRSLAEQLGLCIEQHTGGIWGIGETPLPGFKGRALCYLSPLQSNYPCLSSKVIVLDNITSPLPGFDTPSEFWTSYLRYPLADPKFWKTRPIDFLVGCDLFSEIITGDIITISKDLPRLLGTVFGYTVLGRVRELSEASSICALHATSFQPHDPLTEELRRFWELEEPPLVDIVDPDEKLCEDIFSSSHYRLPDGRYVVRLPFRTPNPQLSTSRGMAIRRLNHLENKLEGNSHIREKYHEFMHDYLELDHMEVAAKAGKYLIPHHCVIKGESENLKLRVVFDAASRTATGSLNDYLLTGPKLQTSLVHILLSFRRHRYVFTADAVKMFRQILVHPDDRTYQHILWRFNPAEAVSEFELKTVSYGQSCAPYLALRVLRQLILDEGEAFPLAASALYDDTYIDDVATGASSLAKAVELLKQLVELLGKGGFVLSKWAANHPDLIAVCHATDPAGTLPPGESVPFEAITDPSTIKILGMQWNPNADVFSYKIIVPRDTYTKRAVLSAVAKIYDPLGYLGPTVVLAKQLVQDAWKENLSWDDEFPGEMRQKWKSFLDELPVLAKIKIQRWVVPDQGPYTILVFADASEKAYCTAAYLRTMTPRGPQVHLLMAKTKLAPVKFTTIPRLELCAALLAARLWKSLVPFCQKLSSFPSVHFFSDSMVVLSWLRTPYHLLKTFVANRVVQIRDLTAIGEWRHVSSSDNPSDLGSRGISATDLLKSTLWFHGPCWATFDVSDWQVNLTSPLSNIPDLKPINSGHSLLVSCEQEPLLITWMTRFSSFIKLIRSLCYVLRFIERIKGNPSKPNLTLSLIEIRKATTIAIQVVQRQAFFDNCTPTERSVIPKHLASLNPFLNEEGVLMVGGRLNNSSLSWRTRHPALLPRKAHFSTLILDYYHRLLLHPGATVLIATIRSQYWIPGVRSLARNISRNCAKCRRFEAKPCQPIMGDLPIARFSEGRAFMHVGVDFAGPFSVKESLRRKAPSSKAYLCLMVCLSTKALHLELVSSLSTPAFLAALERFIGRRGLPVKMYSDNGTNFVGAARCLKEFYSWYSRDTTQGAILSYALQKEMDWSFIPPHAPSFGGIWEAGVKAVKRLLRTVYGDNILSFEEFSTLLTRVEAILNSRPLCPLSSDPNDLEYLSPGHFLIGAPLLAVPEPSLYDVRENRLSRWELVSQKAQHFWKRWRREYLVNLQERSKWRSPAYNLQLGDLVLIMDDNVPRLHWPSGRVKEVFPGKDKIVRVVSIQTATSVLKRPVNKLVPLFSPNIDKV